jgi:hypothetical protein
MAKQYVVTEEEFHSLIDSLMLADYSRPHKNNPDNLLTPQEANRLNSVHRHFHHYVVRWIQAMGCSGVRGID